MESVLLKTLAIVSQGAVIPLLALLCIWACNVISSQKHQMLIEIYYHNILSQGLTQEEQKEQRELTFVNITLIGLTTLIVLIILANIARIIYS